MRGHAGKHRIGPYKVGKKLGKGAFSEVRLANHVDTGEEVAIKSLLKADLVEAGAEEEVLNEIKIMATLKHPALVNLKEVLTTQDKVHLVMESVTGGNLFDRIVSKGPMKESEAREVFAQLLDAIEYCHNSGIFHRDIKGSNVLLTQSGSVKLADFGLGAVGNSYSLENADEPVLLTRFCGTANCAAPEVLTGKEYAGGPADIWSLGVLLYFLTAGRPMFSDTSFSGLRYSVVRAKYHVPLWLSPTLVDFLQKLINPDPSARATIQQIRNHAWLRKPESISSSMDLPTLGSLDSRLENRDTSNHINPTLDSLKAMKQPSESMNAFELMASALDISSIFDKQMNKASRKLHFTTRELPAEIWSALEAAVQAEKGILKMDNFPWRGRIQAMQTPKGPVSANLAISTIHEDLLMVSFLRISGSQTGFSHMFHAIIQHPACHAIIATDISMAPSEGTSSHTASPLSSPASPLALPKFLPASPLSEQIAPAPSQQRMPVRMQNS